MPRARLIAPIPISIEFPADMDEAVADVIGGEYECGLDGTGLSILDIGANVGSFALWADRRWPGSTIHCYEPNPGTFAYLARNTAGRPSIHCVNAAVYPMDERRAAFFSRFDGDGEAGLMAYAGDTFAAHFVMPTFEVDVVAPASLPKADIVKIDIEGGEGAVLAALDLSATSLVLAEFQNRHNRVAMQAVFAAAEFEALKDVECPWDPILVYRNYRQDLAGDVFGHMYYARRGQTRLTLCG